MNDDLTMNIMNHLESIERELARNDELHRVLHRDGLARRAD